jgi:hypothetical protein
MTLVTWTARAALITTLAGAAGLACAQTATAPPAPASPAKKELVQKLVTLQQSGFEGLARSLAEQSIAQLAQQAGAVLQSRVAPEQREALAKDVQAEFVKYGDDVGPLLRDRVIKLAPGVVGPVLEEKLSEDELKQVVAALESPGFRKYMQLTPELQRALGQKLVADTQAQVEPKLKALEQIVTKKFSAAGAGATAPAAGPATPAPSAKPAASGAPKAAASGAKK